MVEITYISPLKLPNDYVRTPPSKRRSDNGFPQLHIDDAITYLHDELAGMKADRIQVYSESERLDNKRLRVLNEKDSAICLEIGIGSKRYFLVCDKWHAIEHNLYALHLTLRAIKNIEKWGVAPMEALLEGFNSIKTSKEEVKTTIKDNIAKSEWMETLGLDASASLEDANSIYRRRAKEVAEDGEALMKLNRAIEAARIHFKS